MPRFFIDTDDGDTAIVDADGHDLADARAARDLAVRALCEMLQGGATGNDRRLLGARVRAADGRTLYGAALTLAGAWQADPPAG